MLYYNLTRNVRAEYTDKATNEIRTYFRNNLAIYDEQGQIVLSGAQDYVIGTVIEQFGFDGFIGITSALSNADSGKVDIAIDTADTDNDDTI